MEEKRVTKGAVRSGPVRLWLAVVLFLRCATFLGAGVGDFRVANYSDGFRNNNYLWRGYAFTVSREVVVTHIWGGGGPNCAAGFQGGLYEATWTGGSTGSGSPRLDTLLAGVVFNPTRGTGSPPEEELVELAQPVTLYPGITYFIAQGRVSSGATCHYAANRIDYQNIVIGSPIIEQWWPQEDRAFQPGGSGTAAQAVGRTAQFLTDVRVLMGFRYLTDVQIPVIETGGALSTSFSQAVLEGTLLSSGAHTGTDETTLYIEYGTSENLSGAELLPAQPHLITGVVSDIPLSAPVDGLLDGVRYYYRAVAINEAGRAHGEIRSFIHDGGAEGVVVTALWNHGGTVTPRTRAVMPGQRAVFTVLPSEGYGVATSVGGSCPCPGSWDGNMFTTAEIGYEDCTVEFTFLGGGYTLSYLTDGNGTIEGPTAQRVNAGEDGQPVIAVPNTGYHFVEWSDGYPHPERHDRNVQEDLEVTAFFDHVDLAVYGVAVHPSRHMLGAPNLVDVIVQVKNFGGAPSEGGAVAIWGNMPWPVSTQFVGEAVQPMGSVPPHGTLDITFPAFSALYMRPGTNYVRAFVDCYNEIHESCEENNQGFTRYVFEHWPAEAQPIEPPESPTQAALLAYYQAIQSDDPVQKAMLIEPLLDRLLDRGALDGPPDFEQMARTDLVLNSLDLARKDSTNEHGKVDVEVVIENQGHQAHNLAELGIWLHQPDSVDCYDEPAHTVPVPVLPPWHTTRVLVTNLPMTTDARINTLRAFINAGCRIAETDMSNNQAVLTYLTVPYPVEHFMLSATPLANSVCLRWTCPLACGMSNAVVHIRYDPTAYPETPDEGFFVYQGDQNTTMHRDLQPGVTYYYSIWVSDDAQHFVKPAER